MNDAERQFRALLAGLEPLLALAPMQDVTDHPFMRVTRQFGGADFYVTEYFRAHSASTLRKTILRCVTENPTGRPVVGQLIGNDIPALVRSARELQNYPMQLGPMNLILPLLAMA